MQRRGKKAATFLNDAISFKDSYLHLNWDKKYRNHSSVTFSELKLKKIQIAFEKSCKFRGE